MDTINLGEFGNISLIYFVVFLETRLKISNVILNSYSPKWRWLHVTSGIIIFHQTVHEAARWMFFTRYSTDTEGNN